MSGDPFNPTNLQVSQVGVAASRKRWKRAPRDSRQRKRRFVMGPIPVDTIARARRAHADGVPVLLAVKCATDLAKALNGYSSPVIAVTKELCGQFGVAERARQRAVRALAVSCWAVNGRMAGRQSGPCEIGLGGVRVMRLKKEAAR